MGNLDALFRRLPADRGDGRTRPRDLAVRADEARRAHRSPSARRKTPRHRATAPGQPARHAVQHGGLPDQAQARRTGADIPHDPGPRMCRIRAARRPASQHLPQFAAALGRNVAPQRDAAAAVRRADHRLRGLCGVGRHRPPRRPLRGGRAARRNPGPAPAHHRPWRAAGAHHRRPYGNDRCGAPFVPAHERQLRPVSAAREIAIPPCRRRTAARRRQGDGKTARVDHPRPPRPRFLDGRGDGGSPNSSSGADFGGRVIAGAASAMTPDALAGRWQTTVLLKRDGFSTVERGTFLSDGAEVHGVLRRLDQVPWWSRPLARHLFHRERRALALATPLGIAPPLIYADDRRLVRGYIAGSALNIARPVGDHAYFPSARAALRALHRAGISHNDLAKEQNWLRSPDGRAYLLDFQLASVFLRRSCLFRMAAYEDLRHFLKHKRRYVPDAVTPAERRVLARKSLPTRIWMMTGKKIYMVVTRGLLGFIDSEGGGARLAYDAPAIEAALKTFAHVRAAAVLDFPDRKSATGLYAFVEGDAPLREDDIRKQLTSAVGAEKLPEFIHIADALPRRTDGIVRRDILRLISTNQVDLIEPLITAKEERQITERLVAAPGGAAVKGNSPPMWPARWAGTTRRNMSRWCRPCRGMPRATFAPTFSS